VGAPGFATLDNLQRAGLIKHITSLGALLRSPMTATAALAASAGSTAGPASLAGVNVLELQPGTNGHQVQLALAADPHVESVSRVPIRYLLGRARAAATTAPATPAAVPPPVNTMWNLQKIQWQAAIANGLNTDTEIHVAVLDTGIDAEHPAFAGSELKYVYNYGSDAPATSDQDIIGHGTHVSGTICAEPVGATGIQGICTCQLSVYKIFGDEVTYLPPPGGGYFAYVVDPVLYRMALAACADAGVQVINLSIGGGGPPDTVESQLFQTLVESGVVVVAAMGNESTSRKSYPAAIPGVVAVGATNVNDQRARFSNYGGHIALTAPGVSIWSSLPRYPGQTEFRAVIGPDGQPAKGDPVSRETDYDAWDGTSMATPHVTAAAALALAKEVAAAGMKDHLMKAVDVVPGMNGQNFTPYFGAGRLNLTKL
jgi:subtilisin family serine protease